MASARKWNLGYINGFAGKKKYVGVLKAYDEEENKIILDVGGKEMAFMLKDVSIVRPTIKF